MLYGRSFRLCVGQGTRVVGGGVVCILSSLGRGGATIALHSPSHVRGNWPTVVGKEKTMQANADQIQELCTKIIAEKDPEKMVLLAKRLDAVIAEREQKLRKSEKRES